MTTGRDAARLGAAFVRTWAATGRIAAERMMSRRVGPLPPPRTRSLLVRQLGLFLYFALRARREQVHDEIGKRLGELAPRQHAGQAGCLRLPSELAIGMAKEPDHWQVAGLRLLPQLLNGVETRAVRRELQQHGGGALLARGCGEVLRLRETHRHVQVTAGRLDLGSKEEVLDASDDRAVHPGQDSIRARGKDPGSTVHRLLPSIPRTSSPGRP